ncbi:MAG: SMI1/KNR4 family protein [Sphingomonas sp.]|uniref:SMI1/KNR4 family protein n=1 Tax=Sphingomonas sp. TaxID=28214 RepID=UPI001B0C8FC6|nr:SMI1/KNR4 family protein [Sphingomonas sp.]MBO9623717.1 SMI1/KNR4 family protein [Sphingomonas sp.]
MDRTRRNLLIGGSMLGTLALAGLLPGACAGRQGRKAAVRGSSPPKRPPGAPRPMLEEDIAPVLARLDAWYAAHLSNQYKFNPPATDAALDAFERRVGLKMPRAYRQLYRWHDGEESDRWGPIYGLPLLPLRHVEQEWTAWNEVLAGFNGNRYEIPGSGWPRGAVDPAYINPRWIALTHDGSGNHIGLDFDPWPAGRRGQVILYGRDEDVKVVLAPSLGRFLEWIAGLLESGNFRLEVEPGRQVLRPFGLKDPPTDHFHDGARILWARPGRMADLRDRRQSRSSCHLKA